VGDDDEARLRSEQEALYLGLSLRAVQPLAQAAKP
jgi:hypothetical protein